MDTEIVFHYRQPHRVQKQLICPQTQPGATRFDASGFPCYLVQGPAWNRAHQPGQGKLLEVLLFCLKGNKK